MEQLLHTAEQSGAHLFQGTHGLHGGPPQNVVAWIEAETLPDTTAEPGAQQGYICVCRGCLWFQENFCHRPDNVCCYTSKCSFCSYFMWHFCWPLCLCVTPTEHKRYRQLLDYRDWTERVKGQKEPGDAKLLSRWTKMTAMPCEKHLYIAVLMAFILFLPTLPFIYIAMVGFVPMPSAMRLLAHGGGEANWLPVNIVLWIMLAGHIVLTLLFIFTHYCSFFCFASICRLCYNQKKRKCNSFFWIRKDVLDNYKKNNDKLLDLSKITKTQKQKREFNIRDGKKRDYVEYHVWTQSRLNKGVESEEVIAMETTDQIVFDQKLGGYLLDLGGSKPDFQNFYVSRCDDETDYQNSLQVP